MANTALRQGYGPQAAGWCGQAIEDRPAPARVAETALKDKPKEED